MKTDLMIGCIADDFTGASDAASFLVQGGMRTVLYNGIPEDLAAEDVQAVVIALKSRTKPAVDAVNETMEAARWLKKMGAKQIYFKYCSTFDSTKDGNIGPVADALLEEYDIPYTILCPALPVNGRKVRNGRLSVNGVPLHESSMKNHPLTPMRDDRVKVLMEAQSRYSAFPVTREQMLNDEIIKIIEAKTQQLKHFYLIPDYYEEGQDEQIIEMFGDLPVLTGGSGLMKALAEKHLKECRATFLTGTEEEIPGDAVLLAGSCSAMTLKQIAAYQQAGRKSVYVDPKKLLTGELKCESLFEKMDENAGEPILYYSSDSAENVRAVQQEGAEKISTLLEGLMEELALYAKKTGRTRIIVAGGETSGAVTKGLGYQSYYVGKSIAPGVPVLIPCSNPEVRLVLKSGNFGEEDFFEKALSITADKK